MRRARKVLAHIENRNDKQIEGQWQKRGVRGPEIGAKLLVSAIYRMADQCPLNRLEKRRPLRQTTAMRTQRPFLGSNLGQLRLEY